MNAATVTSLADKSVVTIHITHNTAYIANLNCRRISAANSFRYITLCVSGACSHNITTVIGSTINRTIFQITGDTTYVMCAIHCVFFIDSISNIYAVINPAITTASSVNLTYNAAYIARLIIVYLFRLIALYISAIVSHVINCRIAFSAAYDTSYICYIDIIFIKFRIASRRKIFFLLIPIRRNIGTISGIFNSGSIHTASNATNIITAGNRQSVFYLFQVCTAADAARNTADIVRISSVIIHTIYLSDISSVRQTSACHAADQTADILRTFNLACVQQFGHSNALSTAHNTAHIRAACAAGNIRTALYVSNHAANSATHQRTDIVAVTFSAAGNEN